VPSRFSSGSWSWRRVRPQLQRPEVLRRVSCTPGAQKPRRVPRSPRSAPRWPPDSGTTRSFPGPRRRSSFRSRERVRSTLPEFSSSTSRGLPKACGSSRRRPAIARRFLTQRLLPSALRSTPPRSRARPSQPKTRRRPRLCRRPRRCLPSPPRFLLRPRASRHPYPRPRPPRSGSLHPAPVKSSTPRSGSTRWRPLALSLLRRRGSPPSSGVAFRLGLLRSSFAPTPLSPWPGRRRSAEVAFSPGPVAPGWRLAFTWVTLSLAPREWPRSFGLRAKTSTRDSRDRRSLPPRGCALDSNGQSPPY
jgi:hypothetical protein